MSKRNELKYTHLLDVELKIDFKNSATIGKIANGTRQIVPIIGGDFKGEKLNGKVINGNDWVIYQADGSLLIDVRLTLMTDDSVCIYMQYKGRLIVDADAQADFQKGKLLDPSQYSLTVTPTFECGDRRYSWLNDLVTVGTGVQTEKGPIYSIYQIH